MISKEALRIAAAPFLLSGVALLGVVGLSSGFDRPSAQGDSGNESGTSRISSHVQSGPPTYAFPDQKLRIDFGKQLQHAKFMAINFESDTEIERIAASVKMEPGAAVGSVNLDGKTLTGDAEFRVKIDSLRTGIDQRDEHLKGEYWFDAENYPEIVYSVQSITHKGGDIFHVEGSWAMRGKSLPLNVDARMTYISSERAAKLQLNNTNDGTDWVRIQAEFAVNIIDYGMNAGGNPKVADVWPVTIDLIGIVTKKGA